MLVRVHLCGCEGELHSRERPGAGQGKEVCVCCVPRAARSGWSGRQGQRDVGVGRTTMLTLAGLGKDFGFYSEMEGRGVARPGLMF